MVEQKIDKATPKHPAQKKFQNVVSCKGAGLAII